MTILLLYLAIFIIAFFAVQAVSKAARRNDLASRKTVTFGDESAVRPNRIASIISVASIFLIWGAFTGSKLTPLHMPPPFLGDTSFTYTVQAEDGSTDDAIVTIRVARLDAPKSDPAPATPDDGFARNDFAQIVAWRSGLIQTADNDTVPAKIIAIDGQPITPGSVVKTTNGSVSMTAKGTLNFTPAKGLQMEPIWLPSPEAVWSRLIDISQNGYQNYTLIEHLGWSLIRVIAGFVAGSVIGIPLGYAMGLSGWFRGWFDPIVEFMRPVPPLALIPLVIIWFGIWETGKIILLFLAALWIMTIAARAGVSGVRISKVHAAYSLGASKWQILRHVIVPNSLPEIFTGARVAMGVCWGTVVAAELVAAQKGAGMMIIAASKFQLTDIVLMGIILIGVVGYAIDILMRLAENWLVPWKGKG